jgi:hypothetical protein
MNPVKLNQIQTNDLLERISATPDKTIDRLVKYLASAPESTSDDVRANTGIQNISNIARNANAKLWPTGHYIVCRRPLVPIPSNNYQWSLIELDTPMWKTVDQALDSLAANDPVYNQAKDLQDAETS